jgi:phosphatidylserine decarboxylase
VALFSLDLSECAPIESYRNLQELFTRKLNIPRTNKKPGKFISPVDGVVRQFGQLDNTLLRIKGKKYDLKTLTGEDDVPNGEFINLYLSPKNYHRFHAPCDIKILNKTLIPGKLYPVNSLFQWLKVYTKNKRVVLKCQTKNKKLMYLVFVGAMNVGNIIVHTQNKFRQGDEIGYFELGSSVIIITEENTLDFCDLKINQQIRYGDEIGNEI